MARQFAMFVLFVLTSNAIARADGTFFEVSDARNIHGMGSAIPAAGDNLADFDVTTPPVYFGPFDDHTDIVLNGEGVYFYAYGTQQSDVLDGQLSGSGSAVLQLGAAGDGASASGNTCSHYVIMFQTAGLTDYQLDALLGADHEVGGVADSWSTINLLDVNSNVVYFDETQSDNGELSVAFDGVLPVGLYRLTVESHATGGVAAGSSGEAGASFDLSLSLAPSCPSDFNGDGLVNAADLAVLLGNWGPCADCGNCPGELDNNCAIGSSDLANLLGTWGSCTE